MLEHFSKVAETERKKVPESLAPTSYAISPVKTRAFVGDRNVLEDALTRHEELIAKQNIERLMQREQMFNEIDTLRG